MKIPVSNQHPAPNPLANLPRADRAAFNSDRQNRHRCLPNTRVDVLGEITAWAGRSDESRIFWLSGIAGTGKSTVALTIADRLDEKKRLGASFFFSRGGGDRSNAAKVFTTLAFQLARVPYLKRSIQDAMDEHLDILEKCLYDQWKILIFEPLSKMKVDSVSQPLIFVFDALDECDGEQDVQHILQLLTEVQTLGCIQLRIFITSRPETPIRLGFDKMPGILHQDLILQDVSPDVIDNDLLVFFEFEFNKIRNKLSLTTDWPGETTVKHLVQSSGRLFIWAATACRFIDQGGILARKRLDLLLENGPSETAPEKVLNEIYTTVLKNSIRNTYTESEKEEHCKLVRDTLGAIVTLRSPLPAVTLANLLHLSPETVHETLVDLHSILEVPKDQDQQISIHHPSFRDFLLDDERCRDVQFRVAAKEAHLALAKNCLRIMDKDLKRDICNLHSPGALAIDVQDDNKRICLPGELQYACRYWVDHLRRSRACLHDNDHVHLFLRKHLLHWLEALAVLGCISDGILMVTILESMLVVRFLEA
jgi:hypothetical protein